MPRISFVSSFVAEGSSARPAVGFAVEHGFHAVELSGRQHWPAIARGEELEWMQAQSAEHDIAYTIHFSFTARPASHHTGRWNESRRQMEETIDVAGLLRASVIVLHPGEIDCPGIEPARASEALRRDAVENVARFLSSVARRAESAGTIICLENMHHREGDVIRSYRELADLVARVDSRAVGVVLDVGHAALQRDLPQAVEVLREHVRHLHLDDARDGVDHREIGTGEIDTGDYAALMSAGGAAIATMEVSDEDDPLGCILRSRDALRARFGALVD